ncbi:MAG: hypothetical protein MJZ34_11080, partial [Paludibacteraceae bacterium]|nr:hypothetical protein [Paludibacteraceae bacterium]
TPMEDIKDTPMEDIKDTPMEEHILPSDDGLKLSTNVMEKLFKAYSHFDFVDVCDMVNYRGGICLETHLERQNIEPRHLQLYVKELCDKCYEKWLNVHNDTSYMENDIYISIAKNGECQISYIPMMASSK